MIKRAIKGFVKLAAAAFPLAFARKSNLDLQSARACLNQYSPKPVGRARVNNCILDPTCDLQIIVPAYNVEQYLETCMDSILEQKTKYKILVKLIDDGSLDRTSVIADKYLNDERVNVIHQKNRGFSGARNRGLIEICGKYIMFVDSDDMLCPGAIEALLDIAFAHDCDIVEGGAYEFSDNHRRLLTVYDDNRRLKMESETIRGEPWAKVFKANLLQHYCFPEGYWFEDTILSHLVYPNAKNIYVIKDIVYSYRRNSTGISSSFRGKPKSVDTYWITELIMLERKNAALPVDSLCFERFLKQIDMNQKRVVSMSDEVQESIFVLTCDLMEKCFSNELVADNSNPLVKALKNRDFNGYRVYCW